MAIIHPGADRQRKTASLSQPSSPWWSPARHADRRPALLARNRIQSAIRGWLIGEGLLDIHGGDQIGLVVETGCRYFSELAFPDKVTAGIRVARLGTSSVRYEVALFRNEEEIAALKAFSSTSS